MSDKDLTNPLKVKDYIIKLKEGNKELQSKIDQLEADNKVLREAVEACAHIGVDCGYGEYTAEWAMHKAREVLEKLKERGE